VKAAEFLEDLEAKPVWLRGLAEQLPSIAWPVDAGARIVLTGMGSSWFAAETAARHMRRAGLHVVAELASVEATYPPDPSLTVIGITASGKSKETLALLSAHRGASRTIALTNGGEVLPVDDTVQMHAGPEAGGVACRSYLHTLIMLLHLQHQLTGTVPDLPAKVRAAADAATTLLDTRADWLPQLQALLDGPNGTWLIAPAERLSNSLQGALMLREGPRRAADGCETGDWNHVDVYLTKTLDYRALVFAGSRFDADAVQWMRERKSTFVAVGGHLPGAAYELRYPGDDDPIVALLTELLVVELVAADWWLQGPANS
jgi:glucosamine 6-phosphate synthetase-like amidotransferase/phosphosugar isomerase protein